MKPGVKIARHIIIYTLICAFTVVVAFGMGYVTHAIHAPVTGNDASMSLFWETWSLIDQHFFGDQVDEVQRTYGAIEGSLSRLGDRYTLFVEPKAHEREQEELRGSFGGIGAWIERRPDGRTLLTPMENQPAEQAGVLAGDELVAVNGTSITPEMTLEDVVDMVKGEIGERVILTLRREGVDAPFDIEIERQEIVTPSISWNVIEEAPDIGYIQIRIFNERTVDELKEAIQKLRDLEASKLIIDLRNNGGGLLSSAIDVTSQFLDGGVVLYDSKNTGEETSYPVRGRGVALDAPLAILINGNTASASEIVAGAIQDTERGKLIGAQTYGKASVQLLFDLSDGSSLHVTNAHWLTPNRRDINGVGLTPDLVVEFTQEDADNRRDPQLQAAIAELQGND
ncbi:MAG: S41 family peptidase [Anaerolineae bacterium]|nr:S41 family peptidase [Anaerolineae bacterium]